MLRFDGGFMRLSAIAALAITIAISSSSLAQLTIQNPAHLEVPEQKAKLLMSTACRVIAENFRIGNHASDFSLTLVLGAGDEHYSADQDKDAYTLFLQRWDESKFTVAMTNLAIQRLVVHDRLPAIVSEVQRRSARVAPVAVEQLRHSNALGQSSGADTLGQGSHTSDCLSAIAQAGIRKIPCGSLSNPAPPN